MAHVWDPDRYLWYAGERGRPFVEMLARVDATHPETIVDLGCGPGHLTALLARRWPEARVVGIDSSPQMIERARADHGRQASYTVEDLRQWTPDEPVDVLVSNATLQWVPRHLSVLPRLVAAVAPGGWFAFSVPGNFTEPSHTLPRDLAAQAPYAAYTASVATPDAHGPHVYFRALSDLGCEVDAWETTYLHVLRGPDPVFEWISGTAAGPTLQALPQPIRTSFAQELKQLLRRAYPAGTHGTVLAFRRVFVVARRA
ncbi:MAG: methyltransferase domain-containing protein [Dermatophilaceae bacterium]